MKLFKLSKTGLLVLAAGAFIVVLACLGMTRYSQGSEEDALKGELALSAMRLGNLELKPLQEELAGLQEKLISNQTRLAEAKDNLVQSVISVDVTDKFYQIAYDNYVIVESIGTTAIQTQDYEGLPCSLTTINAVVEGDLSHIIDFVASLNDDFTTGFVKSAEINIEGAAAAGGTSVNIIMVVYSYEES
jgi:hypothetical protein